MATAAPGDVLPLFSDHADRVVFGQDPLQPASEPFARRWDPRPGYSDDDLKSEVDWIGEDAQGVWLKVDPRAGQYLCPRLDSIIASWSIGHGREMSDQTLDEIASITWQGWRVMTDAQERLHNVKSE